MSKKGKKYKAVKQKRTIKNPIYNIKTYNIKTTTQDQPIVCYRSVSYYSPLVYEANRSYGRYENSLSMYSDINDTGLRVCLKKIK
jgi:hypothetical protein